MFEFLNSASGHCQKRDAFQKMNATCGESPDNPRLR
jgi:hypothetical protein